MFKILLNEPKVLICKQLKPLEEELDCNVRVSVQKIQNFQFSAETLEDHFCSLFVLIKDK